MIRTIIVITICVDGTFIVILQRCVMDLHKIIKRKNTGQRKETESMFTQETAWVLW